MLLMPLSVHAQETNKGMTRILSDIRYNTEVSATASTGDYAPFWLTANQQGLSSVENNSAYLRGGLFRDTHADSLRNWQLGYGADLAVAANYTSKLVVQQLYGDLRYKAVGLSVGAKERPMEMKNNLLSTGSQTLGINARPVPQVRIGLPEYWNVPLTRGWVQIKGHIAYGKMTDDNWQHDFTNKLSNYTDNLLYHSKAGYLRIYNEDYDYPLSLEAGLEMATLFGGTCHQWSKKGIPFITENGTGLKSFWNAFIPGGGDVGESQFGYTNVEGNQLGSWMIRVNYDKRNWRASVYIDHFFEDQSGMFLLDYDGYGTGNEWNVKKKRRYLLYDFRDMMLGTEINLKQGTWLRDIVLEYIYTKYQSGPIYHDHNPGNSDHLGGKDNYYNHDFYPGWQHWGQVIGNPLFTSPIYNESGQIKVTDNRFMAFHLGFSGRPTKQLCYRFLATWKEGLGTYKAPFYKRLTETSLLAEANYDLTDQGMKGWKIGMGVGLDQGKIIGNNFGATLTLKKQGFLTTKSGRNKQ